MYKKIELPLLSSKAIYSAAPFFLRVGSGYNRKETALVSMNGGPRPFHVLGSTPYLDGNSI